jgi:lactoylglutathione lyase
VVFTEVFPILSTTDLDRALRFYRDLLDGRVTYEFPGPDGVLGYVGLELGSSHLGIGCDPTATALSGHRAISLWVYGEDCDAAVERLREGGFMIVEEPTDQPWGERVARVHDADGNVVIIGARQATASADPTA